MIPAENCWSPSPVVTRPIWLPLKIATHIAPSCPALIPSGSLVPAASAGVSCRLAPAVLMRAIRCPAPPASVNQTFRSGPEPIPSGFLPTPTGNSVIVPALTLTRPILSPLNSVNHMFPSGPCTMSWELEAGVVMGMSASFVPAVVSLTISLSAASIT